MSGRVLISLTLILGLSACETRLNPMNWFSGGKNDGVILEPLGGYGDSEDRRALIPQVTEFKVFRNSGGAILQVTGLPARQGYWSAELVAENDERPVNGVLTYTFRISEPLENTPQGSPYSREIIVAHFVSDTKLAGVRQIRVVGANNSMTARR